jgi:hypothetical protein
MEGRQPPATNCSEEQGNRCLVHPLVVNLISGSPGTTHDFDLTPIRLAEAPYAAGGTRTDTAMNYADDGRLETAGLLVYLHAAVPVRDAQCQAPRN